MDFVFPSKSHEKAFWATVDFFKKKKVVLAITLVGSILRGKGSHDADVDVDVFVKDQTTIDELSKEFDIVGPSIIKSLKKNEDTGRFFDIGLHIRTLNPKPKQRFWTSGPDDFEIELGHSFVYCHPVFKRGNSYDRAKEKFFPYYNESLRKKRLKEVKMYCVNNIEHIEPYVKRGLYFQAFKRFHDAAKEFLQALFISKKVYPLDYDKWVKYELIEILKMPKLYKEFAPLYELKKLESDELIYKGRKLHSLLKKYVKN
ncbi:MAG: hypothetical protein HYW90_02980 [Candidatus Sungbacteria bacterium]|nr:hypothetical protein [Candidatus Sungbacteria bacterium]